MATHHGTAEATREGSGAEENRTSESYLLELEFQKVEDVLELGDFPEFF